MSESIRKQKLLFLIESAIVSAMHVTIPFMLDSEDAGNMTWDILEPVVAWSCGMAAIGYAKQYLNFNNKLRKLANEAIYPFYLLHQPVIVVVGYFFIQLEMTAFWKAILITLSSLSLTVAIYWLFIRPFNVTRIVFGMNRLKNESKVYSGIWPLKPTPSATSMVAGNKE